MTVATPEASVEVSRSLEEQLSILNAEQQEALFAYYGEKGLTKNDSLKDTNATPEQVQSALAEFISNDNNEQQKTRLLKQLEEYNATYRLREETFTDAEDVAKIALTAKRQAKQGFTKSVRDFTKTLETNLSGSNKELLQQRRIDQQNQQAWEKREKIRVRGIDAYLRGVVAAVIDDMEVEYRDKAEKEADKISKIANAQVKALKDKGSIEPTSEKGTKLILKNSFPKKKEKTPLLGTSAAKTASAAPILKLDKAETNGKGGSSK